MRHLFIITILVITACESPFNTEPTDDEIFSVSHDYKGQKIYHPTPVTIEWSNITIKNFKEFLVERSAAYADSIVWVEVVHILDSLQITYTDTIDDDVTFQYRVRIVDKNDQFIHALSAALTVPNVSSLKVPEHYADPQTAFDSKLMDDGDTIKVYPGLYRGKFQFLEKDITIRAITIPEITLLGGLNEMGSVVEIDAGTLAGFTIIGGEALYGGGVWAKGNAIIRDCIIRKNMAKIDPAANIQIYPNGMGGGVYLQDEAVLMDSRVTGNFSNREGGAVLTDGANRIIRCKIDKNNIFAAYQGAVYNYAGVFQAEGYLMMRNTILRSNKTQGQGGGLGVEGTAEIYNCLFVKNDGTDGGGGLAVGTNGTADLVNCVIYKNRSSTTGSGWWGSTNGSGAIANFGSVSIINTIAWRNIGGDDPRLFPQAAIYTDSDEFQILSGIGNLNEDPLFVEPVRGNFELQSNSPCKDSGHPDDFFYGDTDGSRNDMGIYGGPYGDDW